MLFDFETVRQACIDTLKANEFEEAYIRPIVFLGHGAMGLGTRHNPVRVAVASWKWGAYLGDEGIRNGIRCGTSSYTRHHINANLQRAKIIGHYVNSILARYEANDNGYDEAIMLDHSGYVAEGTGENLFVIKDGLVKNTTGGQYLGWYHTENSPRHSQKRGNRVCRNAIWSRCYVCGR